MPHNSYLFPNTNINNLSSNLYIFTRGLEDPSSKLGYIPRRCFAFCLAVPHLHFFLHYLVGLSSDIISVYYYSSSTLLWPLLNFTRFGDSGLYSCFLEQSFQMYFYITFYKCILDLITL